MRSTRSFHTTPSDEAPQPTPAGSTNAAPGADVPDALRRLEQSHANIATLADALEDIADNLPRVDPLACMRTAALLGSELPLHHADEDLGLFPLLRQRCGAQDRVERIIAQLTAEHVDDEAALLEIVTILETLAIGARPDTDVESIGYALRRFFEGQRRHLAWEDATVMPLARERLVADDWVGLSRVMQANRDGPKPDAVARRQCANGTDQDASPARDLDEKLRH